MREHLDHVRNLHQRDLSEGLGRTTMPGTLARNYSNASTQWCWKYVIQSTRLCRDRKTGLMFRHHLHDSMSGHPKKLSGEPLANRPRGTLVSFKFPVADEKWHIKTFLFD